MDESKILQNHLDNAKGYIERVNEEYDIAPCILMQDLFRTEMSINYLGNTQEYMSEKFIQKICEAGGIEPGIYEGHVYSEDSCSVIRFAGNCSGEPLLIDMNYTIVSGGAL
ncbi:MAG TPA: hypothetical protein ENI05_02205 [Porticoccus sp.]|nr:hypothetical protein [Porticoccus sp.]